MKRDILIALTLFGSFLSTSLYAIDLNAGRIEALRYLIDHNLTYSEEVPTDSIISWEKDLETLFEKEKDYKMLFQFKHMVVHSYAAHGDISIAVDKASKMYDKAKKSDYPIGLALSSRAIGDAYQNANMSKEAIESYKEALHILSQIPSSDTLQMQVLPDLILVLIYANRLEEASEYLTKLDNLFIKSLSKTTYFFVLACNLYYNIKTKDLVHAKTCLEEAEVVYLQNPHSYYRNILDYLLAYYYQAAGDYELALKQFNNIYNSTAINSTSNNHIRLQTEQASLLAQIGRYDEACQMYRNANILKDSLNAQSYVRQINMIRAIYQIDRIDLSNKVQHNRITLWIIIAIILILALVIFLLFRFNSENKKLIKSKEELEKARKYAESSIRTKSVFLSNMSHEIRTPLNALSGFSSILTDESIDSSTRQQCNDIIQQNSELLLKLINDVIDLSSLDVGKLSFHFKECDAVAICRNVIDTVEKVKQTQAKVLFSTTLESFTLTTDDSRLQQVLINLLINATKFTTEGTITLELHKESDETAVFSVTDTGCGIPLEKQETIFNRFEKLNEGAQGTGLGLSICQLIIEQIGGKIWIDPTYTKGAKFVFTHPVHTQRKEDSK